MAVSLLNLGESTTQTIGAFLVRMSSVISTRFESWIFLTAMIALSFGRWWKIVCRVPFFWLNFNRFWGVGRFFPGRFCKVFFSTRACHWAFAGTSVEVTFEKSSRHPVMVEERRGGWGQCNTHLVAITQKQDGMILFCIFFCIVSVAACANTWLPLGQLCYQIVDPSGTSISKSLQLLQTRHCWSVLLSTERSMIYSPFSLCGVFDV